MIAEALIFNIIWELIGKRGKGGGRGAGSIQPEREREREREREILCRVHTLCGQPSNKTHTEAD